MAFAEIEPFPSAVLAHRFPNTPNLGDFTKIGKDDVGAIDLLVGGTPCQNFSVAGLRAGLAGDRGALTIEFLRLAERLRPQWLVWENVPGILSIDGGRAFGTFLGLLGKLGYGFAYRILDARHFGIPQRRRRVFVVGCFGDWRRAGQVLFNGFSLSGHPAPRHETGPGPSLCVTARFGSGRNDPTAETYIANAAQTSVRRLLPVECEKLQGFEPGWTAVPYRGKPASDGPRHRSIGNSFAVPVISWIGTRIDLVAANR